MEQVEKKYQYAVIATDVVIFTIIDGQLNVLLMKMDKKPYENCWAFPGGLVDGEESVDDAAIRNLNEKTGVKDIYLEQLYAFGEVGRDPFGRVVSVAYFALIPNAGVKPEIGARETDWWPVSSLPELAYDHKKIMEVAVHRLQSKLEYSNVAYGLVAKEFTMTELQKVYEIVLGKSLDKRNFRKKMKILDLIEPTSKLKMGAKNRPAELYRFKKRSLVFVK